MDNALSLLPPVVLALFGAMLGAILGSWVATVAVRWPQGLGTRTGRSRCDACGTTLRAIDLVPLASWVALRGRCRACGAGIDPAHPAIETACAAAGAAALLIAPGAAGLAAIPFALALILLAVLDARHFWLPDRITLPLAAGGLAAGVAGLTPSLADRVLGLTIGWGALAAIRHAYRLIRGREGMGAGDPKLLAAIGAWLGWAALPFVLLAASGIGLAAAALAAASGRRVTGGTALPLGTLLAIGAMIVWGLQQRGPVMFGAG